MWKWWKPLWKESENVCWNRKTTKKTGLLFLATLPEDTWNVPPAHYRKNIDNLTQGICKALGRSVPHLTFFLGQAALQMALHPWRTEGPSHIFVVSLGWPLPVREFEATVDCLQQSLAPHQSLSMVPPLCSQPRFLRHLRQQILDTVPVFVEV